MKNRIRKKETQGSGFHHEEKENKWKTCKIERVRDNQKTQTDKTLDLSLSLIILGLPASLNLAQTRMHHLTFRKQNKLNINLCSWDIEIRTN